MEIMEISDYLSVGIFVLLFWIGYQNSIRNVLLLDTLMRLEKVFKLMEVIDARETSIFTKRK